MSCEDCFFPSNIQKRVKMHRSLDYLYNGSTQEGLWGPRHCATPTLVTLSPKPSKNVPSGGNYTAGKSTLGKQRGKAQRPGARMRGKDGS